MNRIQKLKRYFKHRYIYGEIDLDKTGGVRYVLKRKPISCWKIIAILFIIGFMCYKGWNIINKEIIGELIDMYIYMFDYVCMYIYMFVKYNI